MSEEVDNGTIKQALAEMQPRSKAAKVRQLLPLIEQKIDEGVSMRAILEVLNEGGMDLTENTLKSSLYRARKKQPKGRSNSSTSLAQPRAVGVDDTHFSAPQPGLGAAVGAPISPLQLEKVMKPDPVQQAAELAHYETIAKHQRRSPKL
ncbi:MAG: conjugal transfer protein TraD [Telluria sp.]